MERGVSVESLLVAARAARHGLADSLLAVSVDGADTQALVALVQELDLLGRRVEFAQAAVAQAAEQSGAIYDDGHRDAAGWLRANTRCSRSEARSRARLGEVLAAMPDLADTVSQDRVPVAHLRAVVDVSRNPRVRELLYAADAPVAANAVVDSHDEFRSTMRQFEQLADFDGAHRRAETVDAGRDASIGTVGDVVEFSARCGIAHGAMLEEIFVQFVAAERLTVLAAVGETLDGRPASEADLPRTAAQRRFDALLAVFVTAASAPVGETGRSVDLCVSVVVDQTTLEAALEALATGVFEASKIDPWSARCHFADGTPLPVLDAAAAALVGRVRRVVYRADGTVIDLGRSSRLFTGSAREAALLQSGRCTWPGCGRTRHLQVDHAIEWGDLGATCPSNADPMCGYHNRWKHRSGFTVRQDATGRWRTHRPDGTELIAA